MLAVDPSCPSPRVLFCPSLVEPLSQHQPTRPAWQRTDLPSVHAQRCAIIIAESIAYKYVKGPLTLARFLCLLCLAKTVRFVLEAVSGSVAPSQHPIPRNARRSWEGQPFPTPKHGLQPASIPHRVAAKTRICAKANDGQVLCAFVFLLRQVVLWCVGWACWPSLGYGHLDVHLRHPQRRHSLLSRRHHSV